MKKQTSKVIFWGILLAAFLQACSLSEEKTIARIRAHIFRNEIPPAKSLAAESLKRFPNSLELLYLNGWVFLLSGDQRSALGYFGQCLNKDPNHYGGHNGLGALHLVQRRHAEAEKEFQLALAARPDLAEIHGNLAEARRGRGDLSGARQALQMAIDREKQFFDYRVLLAALAYDEKKYDEAGRLLQSQPGEKFRAVQNNHLRQCLTGALVLRTTPNLASKLPETIQKLRQAREHLETCERSDPAAFAFQEERQEIAKLLND